MPKKRHPEATDDAIVKTYLALRSIHKTAAALHTGATTVTRVLKKASVPCMGSADRHRAGIGVGPYLGPYRGSTDEILQWYLAGESVRAIAARIGRSVHVVSRRIRKAGISRPFRAGGPQHSNWKGGRLKAGQGYWRVWVAEDDPMASMRTHQGYVLEHRLVVARRIGRPLRRSETVHHINGDRGDNSPQNLELRQGKHGKHIVMCCLDCGSRNVGHAPLG